MKQILCGTLLLLLPITLTQFKHTPALASDLNKAKDFSASEFDCRVRISKSEGSRKCKLGVIQQEFVIELDGETIKFPIGQIFALGSTLQRADVPGLFHIQVTGDLDVGFITDPGSQTGNRTNFLHASTVYEKNLFALMEELSNQIKSSPKPSFSETVTLQSNQSVNQAEVAKQVKQLMVTKTCIRCDLRAAKLESLNLKGANLEGSNLQGANLSGTDLQGAYLVGATLDDANLVKANLNNVWLMRASMMNANLEDAQIYGYLQGANLASAILRNVDFTSGDRFRTNDLSYVNFRSANLSGAALSGTNLQGANLQGANLQEAKLNKQVAGVIRQTNLSDATLRGADLSKANLEEAVFTQATLQSANLTNASLRKAVLIRSNLQGANLTNADLREANLCGATMPDGTASTDGCKR